jgi:hypothetical protein
MNRKSRVDMTGMYKRLFVIGLLTFCYVQMLAAQNPHSSWLILYLRCSWVLLASNLFILRFQIIRRSTP